LLFPIEFNRIDLLLEVLKLWVAMLENTGNYILAYSVLQSSIRIAQDKFQTMYITRMYYLLGDMCIKSGDLDEATQIFFKTIELSWVYKDRRVELETYDRLGYLFYLNGDIHLAKHYHQL